MKRIYLFLTMEVRHRTICLKVNNNINCLCLQSETYVPAKYTSHGSVSVLTPVQLQRDLSLIKHCRTINTCLLKLCGIMEYSTHFYLCNFIYFLHQQRYFDNYLSSIFHISCITMYRLHL